MFYVYSTCPGTTARDKYRLSQCDILVTDILSIFLFRFQLIFLWIMQAVVWKLCEIFTF